MKTSSREIAKNCPLVKKIHLEHMSKIAFTEIELAQKLIIFKEPSEELVILICTLLL